MILEIIFSKICYRFACNPLADCCQSWVPIFYVICFCCCYIYNYIQILASKSQFVSWLELHCVQKKTQQFVFLAIFQLLIGQIQKVRSVLKSACSEDIKTVLTFDIWVSRSWDIWGSRHQGSYLEWSLYVTEMQKCFLIMSNDP